MSDAAERFLQVLASGERSARALLRTHARLFSAAPDATWLDRARTDEAFAERVETFATRFARLQDILGNKVLPRLFALLREPPRPMIDMLIHAEQLGIMESASGWLALRELRNRLVHEYIESGAEFAEALATASAGTATLVAAYNKMREAGLPHVPAGLAPVPQAIEPGTRA